MKIPIVNGAILNNNNVFDDVPLASKTMMSLKV